ncbi:MAG: 50S ribosomal protein L21 [Lutibacter sp.]|uniref:50S ribosomal protein L21 n=1 Tax=Lutibacter sp. TaxID=1925666 RepID=UPI0017D371B1|nr:50S ribosomal protein L21 [Lutibacter sp.]MBT8318455.1 50S ribosomal protein L21 [Lutibacter sp.]NNJ59313.1 50S ribosomal protein L21 [Lutibacter sp.]
MYAIVEIAGQQFKVAKDQKVYVHRLQEEEGAKVSFSKVLLLDSEGTVTVGAPAIEGAEVTAKILGHLKGDKVIVFKKKRRKGYKKKNGHRQFLTEIQIESIAASGAKKKVAAKKAAPKKEKVVKQTKVATKEAPAKKVAKADDLKKIEGVGPKAAEAMINAGLDTFAKVAKADSKKIAEILTEASSRLAHLVTDTWPKQAGLAAEGKWDELKELQDRLDGGVEK